MNSNRIKFIKKVFCRTKHIPSRNKQRRLLIFDGSLVYSATLKCFYVFYTFMATTVNEKRSQRSQNEKRKRDASTKMDVLSVCATHQENLHHTDFYQVSLINNNYNNILVYENRKFDSV